MLRLVEVKYTYTPTRAGKFPFGLENAHMKLHISTIEFVETAKVLSNTLDSFNVPEKEKKKYYLHLHRINQKLPLDIL